MDQERSGDAGRAVTNVQYVLRSGLKTAGEYCRRSEAKTGTCINIKALPKFDRAFRISAIAEKTDLLDLIFVKRCLLRTFS